MATTRKQVRALFADLRKNEGMIAKASFMCCAGCAGAALDTPENRGRPAVFFHKQETERAFRTGSDVVRAPIHLIYGVVGSDSDLLTEEVGRKVIAGMDRVGVPYAWDGNPANCIQILPVHQ